MMKQSNDKKRVLPRALKGYIATFGKVENPFSFTIDELRELFRIRKNPAALAKALMFALGIIGTPLSLLGGSIAFAFSYKRFLYTKDEVPRFHNLPGIMKLAIGLGIFSAWVVFFLAIVAYFKIANAGGFSSDALLIYIASNTFISLLVWIVLVKWMRGISNMLLHKNKHASAEWTSGDKLEQYRNKTGISIGGSLVLAGDGHGITLGNSGSGKGANFIMPNLLGIGGSASSIFAPDIKAELLAVCGNSLKRRGYELVALNFWDMLPDTITDNRKFNPLDILTLNDKASLSLIDDLAIFGEILVPYRQNDTNSFFTNSARNLLIALLLYMVIASGKDVTLAELWRLVRLNTEQMDEILAEMATCDHPVYGEILSGMAQEIISMQSNAETYGSILANALEATAFMRSPALQRNLVSDFNPYEINGDEKRAVFLVIPADKVDTQTTLYKLVTVSLMRAIVRKPTSNRVTFFMDEAANCGNLSEIPKCVSLYRSYGINLWLVYQDISQLKDAYGDKWQSIWANCEVKQILGITDQFSSEMISKILGDKTDIFYSHDWMGNISDVEAVRRNLATPDEVRGITDQHILLLLGKNKCTYLLKQPYYLNPRLKGVDGANLYDPNPYVRNNL